MNPARPGNERERVSPPPAARETQPQHAPAEAPPQNLRRPTPQYLNPNRAAERENPENREAAPARPMPERPEVNPAPRQAPPPRVATPSREEVREGAPERGAPAHPQQGQPQANRGRRPTPRPTPQPD
jgi:hypothetical protein